MCAQFPLKCVKVNCAIGLDYSTNHVFLLAHSRPCCTITHGSNNTMHLIIQSLKMSGIFCFSHSLKTYKPWWPLPFVEPSYSSLKLIVIYHQ